MQNIKNSCNKSKIRVVYIGYSEYMLKDVLESDYFELIGIVGVKGRLNEEYYNLVRDSKIYFIEIDNLKNSRLIFEKDEIFINADVILIYKYEFIIPQNIVDKYKIINIHGGNLRTNRGAHPIVWSILKQEEETSLSCYELVGGIDEGKVIHEEKVLISRNDSTLDIEAKFNALLKLMLTKVYQYICGNIETTLLIGGIYNRRIEKSDFTIDLKKDSLDLIKAKVLSQKAYFGAVLNFDDHEYRVFDYDESDVINEVIEYKREIIKNNNIVVIVDCFKQLKLYLKE